MLENNETLVKGAKKTRHKGGVFFFGLEDEMEIPTHRTSGADEERGQGSWGPGPFLVSKMGVGLRVWGAAK